MRYVSIIVAAIVSLFWGTVAYAQDADTPPATAAASSSQVEYQIKFISALFDLARVLGMVAGLILILWLSINFFMSVSEKQNHGKLQQMEYKPVTLFRFLLGMMVGMVLFFQPFSLMTILGDIFNYKAGNVCLVLDIKDPWVAISGNGGSQCLDAIKQDIAGSVDVEAMDNNTLKLFFGALQLVSFVFLLIGGGYFMLNMLGAKNMKITTGKSLIIILASSALMISPSIISLANDLRSNDNAAQVSSDG